MVSTGNEVSEQLISLIEFEATDVAGYQKIFKIKKRATEVARFRVSIGDVHAFS